MQVDKIVVALLKKGIELDRVKENGLLFSADNVEIARLVFNDKDTRYNEIDLGFLHENEVKFILERKLADGSGSMVHGLAYLETDKEIEFFANQVLEFIRMDEKLINRFTFKSLA